MTSALAAQSDVRPLDGIETLLTAGRYADVLARASAAEQLARTNDDGFLLTRVELARGAVWQARGFARPAIEHFERALALAQRGGGSLLIADVYGALASAHGDLGQWDRVLDLTERQREADPRQTAANEFRYRFQRGIAFVEFHDSQEADRNLRQALVAARGTGNPRNISMALGELAGAALELDRDLTRALSRYQEALAIARTNALRDLEAIWLLDAGTALRESGDFSGARAHFENAIAVARSMGTRRVSPAALKNLAQVLLHEQKGREAARMFADAQREADEQDLSQLRWETRIERAMLMRSDAPAEAERLFDEALDILEDAQGSVLVEQLRTGALRRALASVDPYDLAIDFLLDQGKSSKAFVAAERGRARAFLEALRLAGDEIARALPAEYLEAEASLLSDISEGQTALRLADLPSGQRRALEQAIQVDEERLRALRLRLASERPAVAEARFPTLKTAEDVQTGGLAPRQALLMFFLGARQSTLWIVRTDGVHVAHLAPAARIEAAAREYLQKVSRPDSPGEPEQASALFQLLLPDVSSLTGVDHLVIVPHGILLNVPFEALRDPSGQRLIERFGVEYAPSASSFSLLTSRRRAERSASTLLAIGNPLMQGREDAATRSVGVEHLSLLKALPFTGAELRDIASVYGSSARILERTRATERELRDADLSSVSILHFATHGLIDEQRPERSALVLTAEAPGDDGVLQVREIYGLKLRDALVTLSACDTALGANVRGEGILGLSRAFFYAGASSVIASLWSVNDRSAASFMTEFYSGLGEGMGASAALRHAKLRFLREHENWSHPYHWATFIVIGDGGWNRGPTPNPRILELPLLLAVLGLAATGGGWIIWRRRQSRTSAKRS
jgi:CHAT domain-containing protein